MDMSTTYMGLKLSNPLVPSASPLSQKIDNIRRMEDAGAGAIVLWSLFEEQIEHDTSELDYYLQFGTERFAESLTYFPQPHDYKFAGDEYLEHIAKAKQAVGIPIIASLNGISSGGWISYARKMQQAGADALELNVYFIPTDPALPGRRVEEVYFEILKEVKNNVTIPVAMKLSPFFSSMAHMATNLASGGADGLVLFNRFYQPTSTCPISTWCRITRSARPSTAVCRCDGSQSFTGRSRPRWRPPAGSSPRMTLPR